jgi:hypothetical protein
MVVLPINPIVLPPIHVKEFSLTVTFRVYPESISAFESSRVKLQPAISVPSTPSRKSAPPLWSQSVLPSE